MFNSCDLIFTTLHLVLTAVKWVFVLSFLWALLFGRSCSPATATLADYAVARAGGEVGASSGGGR